MRQHPKGYLVEDEADELNDETFGGLDDSVIGNADFDFSKNQMMTFESRPPMMKPSTPLGIPAASPPGFGREQPASPLASPSSVTSSFRRGLSAAELEQQILSGKQTKSSRGINLEDLESTLKSSLSFDPKQQSPISSISSPLTSMVTGRVLSPPPGLAAIKPVQKVKVNITFPHHDEDDPEDGTPRQMDPNRHLMTKFEREGIKRIHMAQLTTEKPAVEDFYYQAFSKRSLKNKTQSTTPLYLPLPNLKKKQKDPKDRVVDQLEGVLGKVSGSSSKKPRQLLQMNGTGGSPSVLPKLEKLSGEELYYSVLGTVERLFLACFALEDLLEQADEPDYDAQAAEDLRKATSKELIEILSLDKEGEWDRDEIFRLVNLLALSKGRKAVFRSIKYMSNDGVGRFLGRLVENLDYLDVFRPNITHSDIESFINLILSPIVPFVSEAAPSFIIGLIQCIMGKKSFVYLALSRPGLVLLCILLSRVEICKGVFEDDPTLTTQWPKIAKDIYEILLDRLNDFFHLPGSNPTSTAKDGGDFYVWQFFALIALSVDADEKRTMVVELRDRIMMTAQKGSAKDVGNLNIFLNVLGLDASQLTGN